MKRNCYEYRKIWVSAYGDIPRDENGISYEIHHINGDSTDNRLENLACLSIQEHYDVHYKQGNLKACQLIVGRMNKPSIGTKLSNELRKKISDAQKVKVENGTHHFLRGDIQRAANLKRVQHGTHNFQSDESKREVCKRNTKNIENNVHSLQKRSDGSSVGGDITAKLISEGKHHFQNSKLQTELSNRAKLVNQKPVLKMNLDGEVLHEYSSVQEILMKHSNYKSTIYRKIHNQQEYGGFVWKYK